MSGRELLMVLNRKQRKPSSTVSCRLSTFYFCVSGVLLPKTGQVQAGWNSVQRNPHTCPWEGVWLCWRYDNKTHVYLLSISAIIVSYFWFKMAFILLLIWVIVWLYLTVCLSTDENKPIWMHAEEREEQSKVSEICWYFVNFFISWLWCLFESESPQTEFIFC